MVPELKNISAGSVAFNPSRRGKSVPNAATSLSKSRSPERASPTTTRSFIAGQLGNAVKEARSKAAIAVAEQLRLDYIHALEGSIEQVLFEEREGDFFTGHTPNYVKVYAPGEQLHNEVRSVLIEEVYKDGVLGRIV